MRTTDLDNPFPDRQELAVILVNEEILGNQTCDGPEGPCQAGWKQDADADSTSHCVWAIGPPMTPRPCCQENPV